MQNANCRPDTKCRLGTKCRLQTAEWVQNADWESKNLNFFVWYVITCHLTTYRASCNRFSAISFHDYLHYCGIFLAHFLMKIDRNITSSLYIVFSLCARVGWWDEFNVFICSKRPFGWTVFKNNTQKFQRVFTLAKNTKVRNRPKRS